MTTRRKNAPAPPPARRDAAEAAREAEAHKALLQRAAEETGKPQKTVLALVDASVDALNAHVRQGDLAREAAADHLFRVLLKNDVGLAFAPEPEQPATYLLVKRRTGQSLDLDGNELVVSVRIAALNQLVHEDTWQLMRWSKKRVLAGLVRSPSELKLFREGLKVAGRLNMGVRPLRAWVESRLAREDASTAAQAGPTLATGRRIVRAASPLSAEAREVLVRRVAAADPETREALLKSFRKLARDAADFVREVEEYDS